MTNRRSVRTSVVALLFASVVGAISALAVMAFTAAGASVSAGFVDEGIVSGLTKPTGFAFAPDGRIFIIEEAGDFKVFGTDGTLLATTHIDANFPPPPTYTERGLLGIALDPNFVGNQFVYLFYTRIPPGQPATSTDPTVNRVSRFTLNGDQIQTISEVAILDNIPAVAAGHHAGDVHFGADGKLWVSTGDGNDQIASPMTTSIHGKLLRLNPDGSAPSDNPFYDGSGQPNDFVWARGFRNPWRFTFHPTTHAPFIADVGQGDWEELDIGYPGADYGWPAYEGPAVYLGPASYVFTAPLTAYNHSTGCTAIMGGDFVYGPQWPSDYQNNYFYSDLACGKLWRMILDPTNPYTYTAITEWATGLDGPVTIKRGLDGFLYYLNYGTGELRRIRWRNMTYTIAGRVTYDNGSGIADVIIAASLSQSTTTNSNGDYLFNGLLTGTYTLTATKQGNPYLEYFFRPVTRTLTLPPNATGQDFTGTVFIRDYGIVGRVTTFGDIPLAGVVISDDVGATVLTNDSGTYLFFPVAVGTHTLTPLKSGYVFTPTSRTVTVPPDWDRQDFMGQGIVKMYLPLVMDNR